MRNFWCEVYLSKIQNNIKKIEALSNKKKIIAVVKGNAYGLGIENITEYLSDKVDMFAVADINEAKRVKGNKSILLLSPLVSKEDFYEDIDNLVLTIDNEDILKEIPKDRNYRVHIYVDTGMKRMGIKAERLDNVIKRIGLMLPNIKIEGIYTHLHNTVDVDYTLYQIMYFKKIVKKYIGKIRYLHCLNSTALLYPNLIKVAEFTNMIRCGNLIYGYEGVEKGFSKTFDYFCVPINEYMIKKGESIGYGCSFKAKKDMSIGILGLGNIEHLGYERQRNKSMIHNILRTIYNQFRFRPIIFYENKGVEIVGGINMNSTIIDMKNIRDNPILRVEISPILADSSISKVYKIE